MSFETDIHCDGCGDTIFFCSQDFVSTKGRMIERARKEGWSIGKHHLCPKCKKNRAQLKKEGMIS